MTGEITLSGKVLPVGGIKEKAIAAKIQGYIPYFVLKFWTLTHLFHRLNEIILPKQNETEWDLEIPDFVKENLTVHFVDSYAEMFEIVFGYHIHSIPLFDSRRVGGDFIIGGKQKGSSDSPATRVWCYPITYNIQSSTLSFVNKGREMKSHWNTCVIGFHLQLAPQVEF